MRPKLPSSGDIRSIHLMGKKSATCSGYAVIQRNEILNGLLMRKDLHRLLDEGCTTLDPVTGAALSAIIFERVRDGKDNYTLEGQLSRLQDQL
jgi:hypothetical protein